MVLGVVEGLEGVIVVLYLRPLGDKVAEPQEYLDHVLHGGKQRVLTRDERRPAGERHVQTVFGEGGLSACQLLPPLLKQGLKLAGGLIDELADSGAVLLGEVLEPLAYLPQQPLAAEEAPPLRLQLFLSGSGLKGRTGLVR